MSVGHNEMVKNYLYIIALSVMYFLFFLSLLLARFKRQKAVNKMNINFNLIRSYVLTQVAIELPLAIRLFYRGHNVTILIDDGLLTSHDTMQFGDDVSKWRYRRFFGNQFIKFLNQKGFKLVFYSELLKQFPIDEKTEKILSVHVRSSLVRYYRSVDDDALLRTEDDYVNRRQLFQKNAKIAKEIGNAFVRTSGSSGQVLVTSHALYSTWGPFFDVIKTLGWPIFTYAVNGFVSNGVDIGINEPATFKRFNPDLVDESEHPPSFVEDLGRDLLLRRIDGESEDVKRITALLDRGTREIVVKSELYESTALMLPNVLWDNVSAFSEYNIAFTGICDWIRKTIAWYIDNPAHLLIIKPHPGEGTLMDVKIRVEDYIRAIYPQIENYANIRVLTDIEKNVKTSTLFNKFDKFLIYNGTVLYEAIQMQQPVIVAGEVPLNRQFGLYAQPTKIEDYYALLKDKYIPINKPLENFYYYCGFYFKLSALKLNSLSTSKWQMPKLRSIVMAPFKCQGLIRIVKLIEHTNANG